MCYVSDTVAGLLALAARADAGPVNLGNPVERTVTDLARAHDRRPGWAPTSEIVHLPAVVDDPQRRCPDITRAARATGLATRGDAGGGPPPHDPGLASSAPGCPLLAEEILPV